MKSGWEMATLGEVCHVYQPQTLAQKALSQGPYPVFGANGQIGWHSEFNHENEELVLGCRGSVGSVHVTPRKTWINGNAMVVRPKDSRISIELLKYAFLGGIKISDAISGTAQPQITRTSLSPLTICFPTAKAEQYQLTKKLDKAFAGLAKAKENAEKNLQNARALFESNLESVFTRRGPGWVETQLSNVCERLHQGLNTAGEKVKFYNDGYPIIQTRNIEEGVVDLDNKIKFMCEKDWQNYKDKFRPELGDVFFTNIGTIGKTAIVTEDRDYLIHWNIFKLRPRFNQVTSEFLRYTLEFLTLSGYFAKMQKGGTVDFVTKKMISEALIYLPSIAEQKEIAAIYDALRKETQRLARLYEQKLEALESFKKSILHEAFTGNL